MNLNELVRLSNEVRLALIESGGEVTDETFKALAVIEKDLPKKADGYKFLITELESESEKFKAKADEYLRLSKSFALNADFLKDRIKKACEALGETEIFGNEYRWKLQCAKPSVVIDDDQKIPGKYKEIVQTFKVNKAEILKDIGDGKTVDGAHLEASTYVRAYLIGAKK